MANQESGQTNTKPRKSTMLTGRAASALNATDHGLCGTGEHLLPGETESDRKAIRETWYATYELTNPGVAALLDQLIVNDRLQRHAGRCVLAAEVKYGAALSANASDHELAMLEKRLSLLLRYKTTHERSFQRSLRNLEQFASRRKREEIAERRAEIYEVKTVNDIAILCRKLGEEIPQEIIIKRRNGQHVISTESTDQPSYKETGQPLEDRPG